MTKTVLELYTADAEKYTALAKAERAKAMRELFPAIGQFIMKERTYGGHSAGTKS